MPKTEILKLTLGELDTNCYLVWCPTTFETLIIDPADSGDFITETLLSRQLHPVAIILTHGHFDHVLGLLELKLNFPVPIMMAKTDQFLLAQAARSAHHWLKHPVDPVPPADSFLKDGQKITFGHSMLTVMATPGHTPGSVCLHNDDFILTGDTLFKDGVGRTDFHYSKPLQLAQS